MEERAQIGAVLGALLCRGWYLRDVQDTIDRLMDANIGITGTVDERRVETELTNMDLREIGGKALPESSVLKRSSHLQGPKILQVVFVRDIYRSKIELSFKSNRRLLMFCLTDGKSDVTAIEYPHIPSITEEIVPGTKVRLENRIPVHSGILCLESKMITVLGGHVQSLYEEWQMSKKYSGFSRSDLKLCHDSVGPPPFEKFQVELYSYDEMQSSSSRSSCTTDFGPNAEVEPPGVSDAIRSRSIQSLRRDQIPVSDKNIQVGVTGTELTEESVEGKSMSSRPKEVSDAVPVQNQAAAQKLLQKMIKPERDQRPSMRGQRVKYHGKVKGVEPVVFTLDEWERKKSTTAVVNKLCIDQVSHDEEIARQFQRQLDLDDQNVSCSYESEAEKIRSSMFNFERQEGQTEGRHEFRGRGRGRDLVDNSNSVS